MNWRKNKKKYTETETNRHFFSLKGKAKKNARANEGDYT